MDSAVIGWCVALVVGVALGAFYFGGLRLTVEWLTKTHSPGLIALLAQASFVARTVVALAAFLWVGQGQWQRYAAAMVGFVLARIVLVRTWRRAPRRATEQRGENNYDDAG